jgi:hypothetical protein
MDTTDLIEAASRRACTAPSSTASVGRPRKGEVRSSPAWFGAVARVLSCRLSGGGVRLVPNPGGMNVNPSPLLTPTACTISAGGGISKTSSWPPHTSAHPLSPTPLPRSRARAWAGGMCASGGRGLQTVVPGPALPGTCPSPIRPFPHPPYQWGRRPWSDPSLPARSALARTHLPRSRARA